MTLMVRDEADIVGAMLEHHFSQGVDHIIATDNASVDGTTAILEEYAARGLLTLHHDPRHEKQQARVVTAMAREAAVQHSATWVLNADADEFWVAEDRGLTLREALERIPTSYRAFDVPVIDMTGDPAFEGSGISRLIYRDRRPVERINALGLHAHATHDVVFVGNPDVEVAQGNHFVNIESQGRPDPGQGIEVLHLPWRSWKQFRTKVENAGKAYERSGLTPSPNHHGMRDYRRLNEGRLFPLYLARHPGEAERQAGAGGALRKDTRLAETLSDPVADVPVPAAEWKAQALLAEPLVAFEAALEASALREDGQIVEYRVGASQIEVLIEGVVRVCEQEITERQLEVRELRETLDAVRGSRVMRLAAAVGRMLPGRR